MSNKFIGTVSKNNISVYVKEEYLNHPFISGNKLRKLKYNVLKAKEEGYTTLVTFGGAFSNHIAATAAAGKEYGFKTIGVIRGEELVDKIDKNPTLSFAKDCGMRFKFVTRTEYRNKTEDSFITALKKEFGAVYILPEGGTNALAVKGCEEILTPEDEVYDYICCAAGTGGTVSGIINAAYEHQQVLAFPALKGDFLKDDIAKFVQRANWQLITNYHFGGYGKVTEELIAFMNDFYQKTEVPLDPVYTAKLFFGVYNLIAQDFFKSGSKILLIHTGGLQGIKGMNEKLKKQNRVTINYEV